jgi:hypothetical protein
MKLPAYESPLYERALEIISMDIEKLHAHDRTVRSIATASDDLLPALRDQLNDIISDAVYIAENEIL